MFARLASVSTRFHWALQGSNRYRTFFLEVPSVLTRDRSGDVAQSRVPEGDGLDSAGGGGGFSKAMQVRHSWRSGWYWSARE